MKDYELIKGYIYKVTSPDGKLYIGQTINVPQRKNRYKAKNFKGQIRLWNSCIKYNWNPIDTFEVIDECICGKHKTNLNEKEVFWINFFESDEIGLNCNKGGNGNLGKKHTEETKKILSKKTKEQWASMSEEIKTTRNKKIGDFGKTRKHSQETIQKIKLSKKLNPFKPSEEFKKNISESLKGKPGRNSGNKHSIETKNKISESKSGIPQLHSRKQVICLTNGKKYNSIKEAAFELSLNKDKISLVCNGKRKMTGGYEFKFI